MKMLSCQKDTAKDLFISLKNKDTYDTIRSNIKQDITFIL